MAFDIKIVVEAVDKASAVLGAIRSAVSNLNQITNQVAGSAGGIGGAIGGSQTVLKDFAESVNAIPNTLGPLAEHLAESAAQFTGLTTGAEAGTQALANLDKVAVVGAPAVSQVAEAIGKIEQKGEEGAASTRATAQNIAGLAKSIQETGVQSQPASSSIAIINEALVRLSETTDKVVSTQAIFAQSTARLAPLLAQNAQSIRQANEQTERSLSGRAAATARQTEGAYSELESSLKLVGLGLKDVNRESDNSASTFSRVKDVIKQNSLVFAGLSAAIASIPASLALLTRGAIATGDSLNDMATSTGLSVEFLSSLDLVARQNGGSLGEVEIGLKGLAKALVDAGDPASDAAKNLRALGIDVRHLNEDQKQLEAFLPILADGFTRLENGAGKLAIAQALLGRAGERLIPTFNQGAAGFENARKRAKELEVQMSAGTAAAADQLNDKMTELGAIFRGLGNQIAAGALPYLTRFVDFALEHSTAIKVGFLGIAAAVTAIGIAIAAIKIGGLIDALLTAIAGPAALAKVTSMTGLIIALKEGFLNLLAPLGTLGGTMTATFGGALLARLGLVGLGIAAITATIYAGVTAWNVYKAKKAEALAAQDLADNNQNLRKIIEKQVLELEQNGKITQAKANEVRSRLEAAFTPQVVRTPIIGRGGVTGFKTEIKQDTNAEAAEIRRVTQELSEQVTVRESATVAAREAVLTAKTEIALAQSKLEIFKAQKELELTQVQAQLDQPGSTLTIDESVRRQKIIHAQLLNEEASFVRRQADVQIAEIRRQAASDPRFKDLKDKAAAQVAIAAETANEVAQVEAKRDSDLAQLQGAFDQRVIELTKARTEGQIEVQRRSAEVRLQVAQVNYEELTAAEIEFQRTVQQLQEAQKNLPKDQRLTDLQIQQVALRKFQHDTELITERAKQRNLDLTIAQIDAERTLAASDPTPNAERRQQRLNDLLQKQNELIRQQIELNRESIQSGNLSPDEVLERRRKILELETQRVNNNRAANLQDPTNLPRFQSELGFQNKLTADGLPTGERELIAPFRALDDFLTGTLQTTFNSLSTSLAGLVTGATTWAQVWTQAGNQIIGMIVQLILEYTLFHQIRSALDSIFHAGARANIATTASAGKVAQTQAAATAAATSGTVATAAAPAAAATSIWSFGSSATIGLALALAAIGAIVAALAFARGGVVPGRSTVQAFASGGVTSGGIYRGPGGPTDDKILTTAQPGTGILTAAAVQHFGGPSFVTQLLAKRLPLPWLAGRGGAPVPMPQSRWSPPGGQAVPIRVSAGEAEIPPETVAFYGGPRFIDLLNSKRLPLDIINGRASQAVGAKNHSFALGGVVGALERITAPAFAEGGVLGTIDLSHISVQSFAEGGAVSVDPSSAQAARVSNLLQAHFESSPNVNVPPAQVILLNRKQEILEVLRSSDGRAVMVDTWTGAKTELGIRT